MNQKQKELQDKLQKIKQKQQKMTVQTGKKVQPKSLKHATKPHNTSQHYSIGFN
ncbi:hypothetical protein [Lactococcus garvieae]|uniref:Uncharacterized protein n=1 Tax=Lactococcus garvieae DCC43 TaxID=1231377 RepID=K2QBD7_9LACT|nr:hypothetical protein [Lactococcus garvieae]EKF50842.1 hypothetical protein C426_1767 [Lactococcus garvieae DCC43]